MSCVVHATDLAVTPEQFTETNLHSHEGKRPVLAGIVVAAREKVGGHERSLPVAGDRARQILNQGTATVRPAVLGARTSRREHGRDVRRFGHERSGQLLSARATGLIRGPRSR